MSEEQRGFSEEFLQQMVPPSSRQYYRGTRSDQNQIQALEAEIAELHEENKKLRAVLEKLCNDLEKAVGVSSESLSRARIALLIDSNAQRSFRNESGDSQ